MIFGQFRTIIFDFDYTLADSSRGVAEYPLAAVVENLGQLGAA